MLQAGLSQARSGVSLLWRATPSAIFYARRFVSTQDCFLGLANRANLDRTIETQTACGPSFLMLAAEKNIEMPFHTNSINVTKNENTAELVGLYKEQEQDNQYSAFPQQIRKNVQSRNGLLIVSFLHDGIPWEPGPLISYLAKNSVNELMSLSSMNLYNSYLKKRKVTTEQLMHMAHAVELPDESFRSQYVDKFIRQVSSADDHSLSFTDVEFGYLFFFCNDECLYNAAVLLPDGSLVDTKYFKKKLEKLLKAKRGGNESLYDGLAQDFMKLTRKNIGEGARKSKIETGLETLPVFEAIVNSESSFYKNNFKMLCLKIETYLLNQVRDGEALLVNLQFPMVHNGAPHLMTLMFKNDAKQSVILKEVFGSAENPYSIEAAELHEKLRNSITYCGSPSANMCIVENPGEVLALTQVERQRAGLEYSPIQIVNNLYDVFSQETVRLRYLNGRRLAFSCPEDSWFSRMAVMARTGFIYVEFGLDPDGRETVPVDSEVYSETFEIDEEVMPNPLSLGNYIWTFYQDRELGADKPLNRKFGGLPKGMAKPNKYPHHIGAASPDNPLKPTVSKMTDRDFGAVKEFQSE